jgi:hypothetical protein
MSDPSASAPGPPPGNVNVSIWRILPTILLDVAIPLAMFFALTAYGAPTLFALVVAGLSPAVNNLRVWVKSRRLEPVGMIVLGFMVIGTVTSLITGSVFLALIKESFLTGAFGLICLGSLVIAERPLLFYVNRQFVAGDDPARVAWWNSLWQLQGFRRAQRLVTAVWGIVYLIEAVVRIGLALVLTPAEVVLVSHVMAFGVLILLILWTRQYQLARREKLRQEAMAAAQRR